MTRRSIESTKILSQSPTPSPRQEMRKTYGSPRIRTIPKIMDSSMESVRKTTKPVASKLDKEAKKEMEFERKPAVLLDESGEPIGAASLTDKKQLR